MNEIATQRSEAAPRAQAITPMEMLKMAVQQGAELDRLEKLMDLQQRWEANEARKAFVKALGAFKANPPSLIKNRHVSYVGSKGRTEYDHASLDHVSAEIGKALSAHGLSHRWDVEQLQGGMIQVTCVLTHEQGHSERVPLVSGPDQSGGKNSIQAIGSTVTYLQRYTLLAATGMAVADQDDDGQGSAEQYDTARAASAGAPQSPPIDEGLSAEQAQTLDALLKRTGVPADRLLRFAFAGTPPEHAALVDIPRSLYERCLNKLQRTLEQRRETQAQREASHVAH